VKCPVCNIDMIVVEHKKIELDYCTRCYGVWFDAGELELLLKAMKAEKTYQAHLLALSEAQTAEKKRRCPICRRKMKKVLIGEEPTAVIDACSRNDGLWFDGGEIEQLINQMAKRSNEKLDFHVVSYFSDVFQAKGKPGPGASIIGI
jgi:Zn-finger nucleic acid-binding protein